jgi:hypothetical protein
MTCGKLVVARSGPSRWMPRPALATPCSASDHHLYAGTPSRVMAGDWSPSCEIFSSTVSRDTRSSARRSTGSRWSQNGMLGGRLPAPQVKGGSAATVTCCDEHDSSCRTTNAAAAERREKLEWRPMALFSTSLRACHTALRQVSWVVAVFIDCLQPTTHTRTNTQNRPRRAIYNQKIYSIR